MRHALHTIEDELAREHATAASHWRVACDVWNDSVRRGFESQFWDDLDTATRRYRTSLSELAEVFDELLAEEEA